MLSYVISLTLLTLAVIIVRAVFKNKMSSRLVYALWLAVLIRMVLPFDLISIDRVGVDYLSAIESAAEREIVISASEKTENTKPQAAKPELSTPAVNSKPAGEKEPIPNIPNIGALDSGEAHTGSIQTGESFIPEINTDKVEEGSGAFIESDSIGENLGENREPIEIETNDTPSPVIPSIPSVKTETGASSEPVPAVPNVPHVALTDEPKEVSVSVKEILDTVWFVGALVTASVFAFSWIVFSTKLVRSRKYLTKSGRIKVYVSDRIASPCVCGIIPKIYVTPEARDSENLSTVILHERVHVSHGDVLWNVIRIAAVSVFWYNPIIWVAAILSKRDAEFACDETVALKLEDKSKLEYARMIVDMTPAKKNYAVSFAGGPIKERVLKLTRKHKNKIIVAVVVVLVIGICCAATFIGLNYVEGNGGETTTATEKETEKGKETEKESETDTENDPALVKEAFEVYEATEENIAKYAPKKFDVSGSEYNFSLIIVSTRDVKGFRINRLNWDEELLVESEEVIEEVGDIKAGESMLITTDSVEIIGYVGISYTIDGTTCRYYPATSGMDGSALLVEIGDNLLSPIFPVIPADQRHIGGWSQGGFNLAIYKVIDGEIAFAIDQYKGFDYSAIAVLRDGEYVFGHGISPYTSFSDYYGNRDDSGITGKLVFGEGGVKVVADGQFFFNEGLNFTCTSSSGHVKSVGFSKLSNYNTNWKAYPEAIYTTNESVENMLIEKGWFDVLSYDRKNISSFCGDPNGVYKWGLELSPYDPEYKTPYYTVVGERGSISVAVRFAYDFATDSCSVVDVYYADRFGNLLSGDDLLGVTGGKTGLDAVLDPSDSALIGFFDSKGSAEKCDGERFDGEENYTSSISPEKLAAMEDFAKENAVIPEELPKFSSDEIFVNPPDWVSSRFDSEYINGDGFKTFRYSYFAEPTFLYPLVGVDAVREWYDKVIYADRVNRVVTDEMYTVLFVKYFEIPKDKFIEAQNEYRAKILPLLKSYGVSTTDELYEEIPADIIYTFDKLIIDEYFWRYSRPLSDKSAEVKAEHLEKAKTDIRYKFICSLISKDVSALAELATLYTDYDEAQKKAYEEKLADISTIVFNGYHVFEDMDNEGQFRFGFTIGYSEFDTLPPGRYEMDLSHGIFEPMVVMDERAGVTYIDKVMLYVDRVDEAERFFIENIIDSWSHSDFTNQNFAPSLALFYLYERANGLDVGAGKAKLTMDELREIALEVYADPDFEIDKWPFACFKGENGGDDYYKVRGIGGTVQFHDVISRDVNGNTVTYTVRYYSDHLQLGSARVVQYVIEKTDSVYGFRLVAVKELAHEEPDGLFTTFKNELEVSAEHLELAKTDLRYKWITSFISGDIEGCAAVLRSNLSVKDGNEYVDSMAPLETITFGRYSVTDIDDENEKIFDSMQFEFTILESGYDLYPPGYYKAVVSTSALFNFELEFTERPSFDGVEKINAWEYEKITEKLEPVKVLFHTAYNVNYPDDPYSDTVGWEEMTRHVIRTYNEAKEGKYPQTFDAENNFTPEVVASWIYSCYRGEERIDYMLNDDIYTVKDGEYVLYGGGGFIASYDIIGFVGDVYRMEEGGAYEFSVDVLYYADIAEFGNAFTVRFSFASVASVYGVVLVKIEKIADNGFDNWSFKN